MESTPEFDDLLRRLEAIGRDPPRWPKDIGNKSVLLPDLHSEWAVHFLASAETLFAGITELRIWHEQRVSVSEFEQKKLRIPLNYISQSISALESNKVEQFLELTLSIAESASALLGVDFIKSALEIMDAITKIKAILDVGQANFKIADELFAMIEVSMQRMLLCSILVESGVGALTGRFAFAGVPSNEANAAYRAPIVARIIKCRNDMQVAQFESKFVHLPANGYWPPGL